MRNLLAGHPAQCQSVYNTAMHSKTDNPAV
jgi:hypothetical protein